jgi:hypothetical protein
VYGGIKVSTFDYLPLVCQIQAGVIMSPIQKAQQYLLLGVELLRAKCEVDEWCMCLFWIILRQILAPLLANVVCGTSVSSQETVGSILLRCLWNRLLSFAPEGDSIAIIENLYRNFIKSEASVLKEFDIGPELNPYLRELGQYLQRIFFLQFRIHGGYYEISAYFQYMCGIALTTMS